MSSHKFKLLHTKTSLFPVSCTRSCQSFNMLILLWSPIWCTLSIKPIFPIVTKMILQNIKRKLVKTKFGNMKVKQCYSSTTPLRRILYTWDIDQQSSSMNISMETLFASHNYQQTDEASPCYAPSSLSYSSYLEPYKIWSSRYQLHSSVPNCRWRICWQVGLRFYGHWILLGEYI